MTEPHTEFNYPADDEPESPELALHEVVAAGLLSYILAARTPLAAWRRAELLKWQLSRYHEPVASIAARLGLSRRRVEQLRGAQRNFVCLQGS